MHSSHPNITLEEVEDSINNIKQILHIKTHQMDATSSREETDEEETNEESEEETEEPLSVKTQRLGESIRSLYKLQKKFINSDNDSYTVEYVKKISYKFFDMFFLLLTHQKAIQSLSSPDDKTTILGFFINLFRFTAHKFNGMDYYQLQKYFYRVNSLGINFQGSLKVIFDEIKQYTNAKQSDQFKTVFQELNKTPLSVKETLGDDLSVKGIFKNFKFDFNLSCLSPNISDKLIIEKLLSQVWKQITSDDEIIPPHVLIERKAICYYLKLLLTNEKIASSNPKTSSDSKKTLAGPSQNEIEQDIYKQLELKKNDSKVICRLTKVLFCLEAWNIERSLVLYDLKSLKDHIQSLLLSSIGRNKQFLHFKTLASEEDVDEINIIFNNAKIKCKIANSFHAKTQEIQISVVEDHSEEKMKSLLDDLSREEKIKEKKEKRDKQKIVNKTLFSVNHQTEKSPVNSKMQKPQLSPKSVIGSDPLTSTTSKEKEKKAKEELKAKTLEKEPSITSDTQLSSQSASLTVPDKLKAWKKHFPPTPKPAPAPKSTPIWVEQVPERIVPKEPDVWQVSKEEAKKITKRTNIYQNIQRKKLRAHIIKQKNAIGRDGLEYGDEEEEEKEQNPTKINAVEHTKQIEDECKELIEYHFDPSAVNPEPRSRHLKSGKRFHRPKAPQVLPLSETTSMSTSTTISTLTNTHPLPKNTVKTDVIASTKKSEKKQIEELATISHPLPQTTVKTDVTASTLKPPKKEIEKSASVSTKRDEFKKTEIAPLSKKEKKKEDTDSETKVLIRDNLIIIKPDNLFSPQETKNSDKNTQPGGTDIFSDFSSTNPAGALPLPILHSAFNSMAKELSSTMLTMPGWKNFPLPELTESQIFDHTLLGEETLYISPVILFNNLKINKIYKQFHELQHKNNVERLAFPPLIFDTEGIEIVRLFSAIGPNKTINEVDFSDHNLSPEILGKICSVISYQKLKISKIIFSSPSIEDKHIDAIAKYLKINSSESGEALMELIIDKSCIQLTDFSALKRFGDNLTHLLIKNPYLIKIRIDLHFLPNYPFQFFRVLNKNAENHLKKIERAIFMNNLEYLEKMYANPIIRSFAHPLATPYKLFEFAGRTSNWKVIKFLINIIGKNNRELILETIKSSDSFLPATQQRIHAYFAKTSTDKNKLASISFFSSPKEEKTTSKSASQLSRDLIPESKGYNPPHTLSARQFKNNVW